MSHDPPEIILIWWFDAQKAFLFVIILLKKSRAASYFCENFLNYLMNRNLKWQQHRLFQCEKNQINAVHLKLVICYFFKSDNTNNQVNLKTQKTQQKITTCCHISTVAQCLSSFRPALGKVTHMSSRITLTPEQLRQVTYTIIQSITSSEMCSLHLTHPNAHTFGAVGGSVPCSRVSPQSWTIPAGAEIRTHNLGLQVQCSIH